jgi:multicomponent Na+:H+ antiporter subunit B
VGLLLATVAAVLLTAVTLLPTVGAPDTPVHQHVAAHYLAHGPAETGADNLVTGVLLNYRSLDTFGEVLVIFTAVTATIALLLTGAGRPDGPGRDISSRVPASPVVGFVVRLMAPFIAIFGLFVLLKGHVAPGGGFQGGVILGALGIALATALGAGTVRRWTPGTLTAWIRAAGPLAFLVIGALGLHLTGTVLGFPTDPARHLLREALLVGLDLGIGIGGAALVTSLFLAVERQ